MSLRSIHSLRHPLRRQTLAHFMRTAQALTMLTCVTDVPSRADLSGQVRISKGVLIAE